MHFERIQKVAIKVKSTDCRAAQFGGCSKIYRVSWITLVLSTEYIGKCIVCLLDVLAPGRARQSRGTSPLTAAIQTSNLCRYQPAHQYAQKRWRQPSCCNQEHWWHNRYTARTQWRAAWSSCSTSGSEWRTAGSGTAPPWAWESGVQTLAAKRQQARVKKQWSSQTSVFIWVSTK